MNHRSDRPQDGLKGSDSFFEDQCAKAGLSFPETKWQLPGFDGKLDFVWSEHEIAVVVGERSLEFRNAAAIDGWRIIECSPKEILDGTAVAMVHHALYEGVRR